MNDRPPPEFCGFTSVRQFVCQIVLVLLPKLTIISSRTTQIHQHLVSASRKTSSIQSRQNIVFSKTLEHEHVQFLYERMDSLPSRVN